MIAALAKYGETLTKRGILPSAGWCMAKSSFAIEFDRAGELVRIVDLREEVSNGKKTVLLPMDVSLPYRTKHSNGISPFCLADNVQYIFGITEAGDELKAIKKNKGFVAFHHQLFDSLQTEKSQALLKFLDKHSGMVLDDKRLAPYKDIWPDVAVSQNIVFLYAEDGSFCHEDDSMIGKWDDHYRMSQSDSEDAFIGQCSITGEEATIAKIHNTITGWPGANTTGAALVSFNLPSADWYGKMQGASAPVSAKIVEQYGNALKYLIKNKHHHRVIGNTQYLFWAENEGDDDLESAAFSMALYGRQKYTYESEADEALYHAINAMTLGSSATTEFANMAIDLSKEFYILGIRSHTARLAPVYFQKTTLEGFFKEAIRHSSDCQIKTKYGIWSPTLYDISEALKNSAGKDGLADKEEEALLQAVLNGRKYPASLLTKTISRIYRSNIFSPEDGQLNFNGNQAATLAALLKAHLLRNGNEKAKEAATVELNPKCDSTPYLIGQLFALMTKLQYAAQGQLNNSFPDKYLSAAAERPSQIFLQMLKNAPFYIRKLRRSDDTKGLSFWYEREIAVLADKIGIMPKLLTGDEQAEFLLGYYQSYAAKIANKDAAENADA